MVSRRERSRKAEGTEKASGGGTFPASVRTDVMKPEESQVEGMGERGINNRGEERRLKMIRSRVPRETLAATRREHLLFDFISNLLICHYTNNT